MSEIIKKFIMSPGARLKGTFGALGSGLEFSSLWTTLEIQNFK
jgi:hypothetical protein